MRKFLCFVLAFMMVTAMVVIPGGAKAEAAVKAAFTVKLVKPGTTTAYTSATYTGSDIAMPDVIVKYNNKTSSTKDDILVPATLKGSKIVLQTEESEEALEATEVPAVEDVATYTVTPTSMKNAGTYTFTVTGNDLSGYENLTGYTKDKKIDFKGLTGTAKFTVKAADISGASASLSPASFEYDKTAHKPAITASLNGIALKENIDYTVSYVGNKSPGTATATLTGKGNYTGTKKLSFEVKSLGELKDLDMAENSTSFIKLAWGKVEGATKYKVYLYKGSKWVLKKTTTATSYKATKLTAGVDYKFKVVTVGLDSNITKEITIPTVPAKVKIEGLTCSVPYMKAKWTAVKNGDGYQVQLATDSAFTNIVADETVEPGTKASKLFDGYNVTEGTTYYARVRAFNRCKGFEDMFGAWSDMKSGKGTLTGFSDNGLYYFINGEMQKDVTLKIGEHNDQYYFREDGRLSGYSEYMWKEKVHYAKDGQGYENHFEVTRTVVKSGELCDVKAGQPVWSNTKYLVVNQRFKCCVCVYEKVNADNEWGYDWQLIKCWRCANGNPVMQYNTAVKKRVNTDTDRTDVVSGGTKQDSCSRYTNGTKSKHFGEVNNHTAWYATKWHNSGALYFHSLLYKKGSMTKLEKAQDSQLRHLVSAGCTRLLIANAKWMYDNIKVGTRVISYDTGKDADGKYVCK